MLRWSGLEREAEAALAGDIPDHDGAVQGGGVQRSPIAADRQSRDLAGVPVERFTYRPSRDVPDEHAVVLGDADGGAAIGAEGGVNYRAVVTLRGPADASGDDVDEAH